MKDGALTPAISQNTVVANQPGSYVVRWTVTNSLGLSGTTTRVVNVVDTTPPVVTPPANVTVQTTNAAGTVWPAATRVISSFVAAT